MIYRISLESASDETLRKLAQKRRMSAEDLANSYVLSGIENARLSGARYLGVSLITAATLLFGVWLMSISVPSVTVAPRALHWLRELVFTFAPWPITILIALWMIARSESAFALLLGVFGLLRKIKLFGAEIELNEQTKRKIQSAAHDIDAAVHEYRTRVNSEMSRIVARYQVEQTLSKFIDSSVVRSFTPSRDSTFRCTIHVPDPVHYGRLYQLLDYCPSGAGRARVFSTRFGIIGKVWRTEARIVANDLLPSTNGAAPLSHEDEIDKVMSDWGMNRREAESALKRRSYACFPLIHNHRKVGLLFMDAAKEGAFDLGAAASVAGEAGKKLAPIVGKILDDTSSVTLQLEFD